MDNQNNLFETLKKDKILASKEKNFDKSTILGTLISEITRDLYNPSSPVEDRVVYAKINKFVENLKEIISLNKSSPALEREMEIYLSYLPKELSESEMMNIIVAATNDGSCNSSIKDLMAYFQKNYPGQFNGKVLSNLIKMYLEKDGLTRFGRLATCHENKS